jgi:hypothetical protein
MKMYKLMPGVYEITDNGKMKYRIYKNRYNGWTLAVFSERNNQFKDSRYFATMKQAKTAIM